MAETKVPISVTVTAEDMADLFGVIEGGSGVFPKGRALFLVWLCEQMRDDAKLQARAAPEHEGMQALVVLRKFTLHYRVSKAGFYGYETVTTKSEEWAETPMMAQAQVVDRRKKLDHDVSFCSKQEYEQSLYRSWSGLYDAKEPPRKEPNP